MAAELWVNDNGTARRFREVWINDNGTARRITEIWANDNGTARKIFAGDAIVISDQTASSLRISPNTAAAVYQLESDGDIGVTNGTNIIIDFSDWITPKSNMSSYECRATLISGSLSFGTTGAWQSLSTTRSWSVTRASVGTSTAVITLEIRRASDAQVVDSATITLVAEVEI